MFLHALLDDPQALADFLDVHHEAVLAVPMAAGGHIEFELLVARKAASCGKSQSSPQARRKGPVTPQSIASSTRMAPMPTVRALKIRFFITDASYSLSRVRHVVEEIGEPCRPSPAAGPARRRRCGTRPGASGSADRLDDVERALAVGEHVEHRRHLPDVLANGAENTRWLMMRNSSASMMRMTCARGGTSIPASFSTAIT